MNSDIGTALEVFKGYFNKYDTFVRLNPRIAAEVEAIIRWSSYLIASRKSPILGELLSSGANLLQLCNDIILRQANPRLKIDLTNLVTQLQTFLTVIQSLELLAEIYARDTYGQAGKWAIITVIQITKAAIRLVLLFGYNQGLSKSVCIVPLDRIHYSEIGRLQEKFGIFPTPDTTEDVSITEVTEETSKSVVLKSSGRKMRSITEAPPRESRFKESNSTSMLNPIDSMQKKRLLMLLERYRETRSATLTERQMYAELLHITRPLAHLALMGAFGTQSWLSYLTSLAMDLSSLYLVRSPIPISRSNTLPQQPIPECFQFNMNERMELGQRASSLLLYLLRSPFFDNYTKQRALEGIATTAESIPLVGQFLATFVNYIPDWQKDYFRVWSE